MAQDEVRFRLLDQVRVPGIEDRAPPLEVFEVLAMAEDASPWDGDALKNFEQALGLYQQRRFRAAADLFNKGRKIYGDPVSNVLCDRCTDFVESPPPDDWDGVFRIESK
jgi:adenylate cyclase